jgi:hypothetical protein
VTAIRVAALSFTTSTPSIAGALIAGALEPAQGVTNLRALPFGRRRIEHRPDGQSTDSSRPPDATGHVAHRPDKT